jgi:hypothetical protein
VKCGTGTFVPLSALLRFSSARKITANSRKMALLDAPLVLLNAASQKEILS